MDFKHIVETNEAYSEKNLNEKDKEFIAGMRWVKENIVNPFVFNFCNDGTKTIIEKMKQEIVYEAIEELKSDIESGVYEAIVSMIDGYEDEDE